MSYFIKAVSTSGIVTWLARPGTEGSCLIASRTRADVLATAEDAWAEIARMPKVFKDAGIRFSVEETCEEIGPSTIDEPSAVQVSDPGTRIVKSPQAVKQFRRTRKTGALRARRLPDSASVRNGGNRREGEPQLTSRDSSLSREKYTARRG
jgi:hypothetical protein